MDWKKDEKNEAFFEKEELFRTQSNENMQKIHFVLKDKKKYLFLKNQKIRKNRDERFAEKKVKDNEHAIHKKKKKTKDTIKTKLILKTSSCVM